jgi:uncharacterized SAM-binding protein YcdF (DUF218 family)
MDLSPFWFGLYKFTKYALYPYTWLIMLLAALTISVLGRLSPRRLMVVRLLTLSSFLLACVLGNALVARFLMASLEEQYPPFDSATAKRFDAVVVLAGGVLPNGTLRPSTALTGFSMERTMCGVEVFKRGYAKQMVLSGGDASVFEEGPEEAIEMKQLAMRLGVPDTAIVIETRSRTTYEGAVEVKRILDKKSLLLVTSASHIPRALALFQKQGLDATPYPCGYSARHRSDVLQVTIFDVLPQLNALQLSTTAITEIVGIAVYRAIGKL